MTTTACDDQLGDSTEKHISMYSIEDILRRNVADLEKELKRQKERAEAANARLRDQIERVTSELERAEAELKAAREREPVAEYDGVEMSRYTLRWIDGPVPVGTKLYASPIPAPAAPAPEEWRNMLQWLIDQHGKAGHRHARPGIWDDDNIRNGLAGKPCAECAMYERARALLQSAEVKK